MNGLIGKKLGMTRVFDEDGNQIPVTVLEVGPCQVVQRKTKATDGYEAVQIGFGTQKEQRLTKPKAGHFKKHGAQTARTLREIRVDEGCEVQEGEQISASIFQDATHVDVIGMTKGRGFQGVVRRHGMSGGRASHGSGNHRATGSIGQCEFPARVFKGKKMPGQMGNVQVTVQNLKVVKVREDDNVILVRGSVPGPAGASIFVRKSIKKPAKAAE